jgi:NADH-quinone oxidoreductase subunit N
MSLVSALSPVLPELWLAFGGLMMVILAAFGGAGAGRRAGLLAIFVLLTALVHYIQTPVSEAMVGLGQNFIIDPFARFGKMLILTAAAGAMMASLGWLKASKLEHPEYAVLVLFATLGMMLMVSANDLLALYLGLELQSLSLYVLAAFARENGRSSEAGLKYFVLGALSSGILLYGISLVYGLTGTTQFGVLANRLAADSMPHLGAVVGLVFILAALAFKVSAAPFHMWTPDVYEGAPTPVTAFFAAAPKVAAVLLLTRVLYTPFAGLATSSHQILIAASILSLLVGAFAALRQDNIKRLMAYSSIGHVGFLLLALAAGSSDGVGAVLIYLAIYVAMTLGTFAVILVLRRDGVAFESIKDLAGLSKDHRILAFLMALLMFSMAGVPPMAGFFAKLAVFQAAIAGGLYIPALIAGVTSAVSAYYYLRIIKVMYFDQPVDGSGRVDAIADWGARFVMGASVLAVTLFCIVPGPLMAAAENAVHGFFGS